VRIWRADDGQQAGVIDGLPSGIHALAWSPTGHALAVGCESRIHLYDWPSMRLRVALGGHDGPVIALAWLESGRALLSSGEDRTVRAWDVGREACVAAGAALSPVWALVLDETRSIVRAADNGAATINRPMPYVFDLVKIEGHAGDMPRAGLARACETAAGG
jgi:WD40 repeat protein